MAINQQSDAPQVLSGWKDIAKYLGKGVRTVQRYEWELRLPVRRPAGKLRGSVVATRADLDAWVGASPIREAFRPNPSGTGDRANAAQATAIKSAIAEMKVLRDKTTELHREVVTAVRLLLASVRSLSGELRYDHRHELDTPSPPVERSFRTTGVLTLLEDRSHERKAS